MILDSLVIMPAVFKIVIEMDEKKSTTQKLFSGKSQSTGFLKMETSGVAALEAALTLPVLMAIIFFIIEMMKVNNARTAINSIALEATMHFVATKDTASFENIIERHRPTYVPRNTIRYYFAVYESLDSMCSVPPYGNEAIYWPAGITHEPSTTSFIDHNRSGTFLGRNTAGSGYLPLSNHHQPELDFGAHISDENRYSIRGKAFILAVVCSYRVSSGFVAGLFAGGANTQNREHFLLWGRGVGICN